jgi:hypothetical protein
MDCIEGEFEHHQVAVDGRWRLDRGVRYVERHASMTNGEKFWYFVGLAVSSPTNVLGLFLLMFVTIFLTWAQFSKSSSIDLAYLLVDPTIGKVTLAKFGAFGAFVSSTWVIVALTANNKFDATAFTVYISAWALVKVAADVKQAQEGTTK